MTALDDSPHGPALPPNPIIPFYTSPQDYPRSLSLCGVVCLDTTHSVVPRGSLLPDGDAVRCYLVDVMQCQVGTFKVTEGSIHCGKEGRKMNSGHHHGNEPVHVSVSSASFSRNSPK